MQLAKEGIEICLGQASVISCELRAHLLQLCIVHKLPVVHSAATVHV